MWRPPLHSELTRARVLAQYRGHWLVAPETDEPRLVPARGRLTETPVTGDYVGGRRGRRDRGRRRALPARSSAAPPASRQAGAGQVLAANVDLALVTEPLPDPKRAGSERFAALAAAGGVPVALVLTKADLDDGRYADRGGWPGGSASPTPSRSAPLRRGHGRAAHACSPRAGPRCCSAPRAPASRRWSTRCSARSGMETGEIRAADGRGRHTTITRELLALPSGAMLIDTPGHARAPACGTARASLRRRRRARGAVPLPRLRPRHRAGLRRPRGARPGTPRRLAQAPARAGLGQDRRAAPRERDERHKQITARCERAGEGNRTPIFGLGSQRLGHWTTPAGGECTRRGYPCAVRMRCSGPSPSPPRRSSACSRTGWSPSSADRTLDDARGQRAAARRTRQGAAAARQKTGQRLAGRLQGQGRGAERVGLVVRAVP